MFPVMAGASMVYGPGMLENGLVMDLGQLVADADIIDMVRVMQRGFPVTDENIALDVIREVGIKGEYLSHEHTFKNFRKEQSNPMFMNRDTWEDWLAAGGHDMYEVAWAKVEEILAQEPKEYVSPKVQERINAIIARCEAEWE
ncbi:Glycine betaine methyltransferase [anaerobic digester metagenome]